MYSVSLRSTILGFLIIAIVIGSYASYGSYSLGKKRQASAELACRHHQPGSVETGNECRNIGNNSQ